ncbi:hypothetical protein RB200_23945 [Streptomyces sp. PmtG]
MRESDRPLRHLRSDDDRVRTAFTVSYEALDEPQRQILHACVSHPGPDFDRHSAAVLSRTPPGICGLMLEELVDAGLLQRGDGRYAFHDLYRSYSHTAPEDEALRRTWLYLHLRRWLRTTREGGAERDWRSVTLPELRAAARAAREDHWHLATDLSCEVADAFREEGRLDEAREEAEAAYRYATGQTDGKDIARARGCLALVGGLGPDAPRATGRVGESTRQEAAAELRRAAEAGRHRAEEGAGPAPLGHLLMDLAERALVADLVEYAMRFQAEAHDCFEAVGDAGLLAECLVGQSALHMFAGQYAAAAHPAERAAGLLAAEGDGEGAAHAHASAAEALRKAGDLQGARRHAYLALGLFKTAGDPASLSYAYRLSAKIAWARQRHALAHRLLAKAHELRRDAAAAEGPSTQAIAHPFRTDREAAPNGLAASGPDTGARGERPQPPAATARAQR